MRYLVVVIALVAFVSIAVYFIVSDDGAVLNDNQLTIKDFNYVYDRKVSHICPGPVENFGFFYKKIPIIITAQDKTFNSGLEQDVNYYPDCVDKGVMTGFYDYSKGFPEGISSSCSELEPLLRTSDNPEFFGVECSSSVSFQILDLNKFNSCISNKEVLCTLVNGVDVKLINK